MDKQELNRMLSKIASDFASDTRSLFPEGSTEPATIGDLTELARQTFYALDAYRKSIIMYLND